MGCILKKLNRMEAPLTSICSESRNQSFGQEIGLVSLGVSPGTKWLLIEGALWRDTAPETKGKSGTKPLFNPEKNVEFKKTGCIVQKEILPKVRFFGVPCASLAFDSSSPQSRNQSNRPCP